MNEHFILLTDDMGHIVTRGLKKLGDDRALNSVNDRFLALSLRTRLLTSFFDLSAINFQLTLQELQVMAKAAFYLKEDERLGKESVKLWSRLSDILSGYNCDA